MTRLCTLWLAMLLALAGAPALALADADEASLAVHALGGVALTSDPAAADGNTVGVGYGGLEVRGTRATSDYYAYEVQLAIARTMPGTFEGVEHDGSTGTIERATTWGRLTAGVSARLGVRYIPTVQLAIGAQLRGVRGASLEVAEGVFDAGPGAELLVDAVALAGLGFDYRHDKHWIVGVSVRGVHAFSFNGVSYDAAEGMVSVSYYWYPRSW